jgi:hypothetical protein
MPRIRDALDFGSIPTPSTLWGVFGRLEMAVRLTIRSVVSTFQTRRANVCDSERNGLPNREHQ